MYLGTNSHMYAFHCISNQSKDLEDSNSGMGNMCSDHHMGRSLHYTYFEQEWAVWNKPTI